MHYSPRLIQRWRVELLNRIVSRLFIRQCDNSWRIRSQLASPKHVKPGAIQNLSNSV